MALMGLDIGTTGCKATIFDESGSILSYAYREYHLISSAPGHFEIDPEVVWTGVLQVIAKAVAQCSGEKVTAICVSSFGEAAVPVDRQGRVLHNSLLYTDTRGSSQCGYLTEKLGLEKIMALTGVHAHPMYTICKILWFKEMLPELYERVWKFMLFEDFILFRLGGEACIDYSLASRTMAFNVVTKKWESEMLEAAGIESGLFSKAVPSGTVIGEISRAVAAKTGLPTGIKLVTGGHDQVCAAIGGGIIHPGMAIDGIGTVECITPVFNRPLLQPYMMKNHFACVPHAVDGMYVTYGFNTGGSLLKWFRDNFSAGEALEAEKTGMSIYAFMDSRAAEKPTDILVLPHFAGAGTPYMDTSARGAFIGLSFGTNRNILYRSLMEGVTYEIMLNMEYLVGAGVEINEIRAAGGGARSDLWLGIKADMTGKKVVALKADEAGTVGTAILAGVATGVFSSVGQAAEVMVKTGKEFYPDQQNHEFYKEQFIRYKRIYQKVKEILF